MFFFWGAGGEGGNLPKRGWDFCPDGWAGGRLGGDQEGLSLSLILDILTSKMC